MQRMQGETIVKVPTILEAREMCAHEGHIPRSILADNGFTYETICGRCGDAL